MRLSHESARPVMNSDGPRETERKKREEKEEVQEKGREKGQRRRGRSWKQMIGKLKKEKNMKGIMREGVTVRS